MVTVKEIFLFVVMNANQTLHTPGCSTEVVVTDASLQVPRVIPPAKMGTSYVVQLARKIQLLQGRYTESVTEGASPQDTHAMTSAYLDYTSAVALILHRPAKTSPPPLPQIGIAMDAASTSPHSVIALVQRTGSSVEVAASKTHPGIWRTIGRVGLSVSATTPNARESAQPIRT